MPDRSSTQPEPEEFSEAHLAALARLRVDAVVVEVAGALARSGVPSILLKGRSIAGWLYDKSEPRVYGDADLLVRKGDQDLAQTVLTRLGFEADRDASWLGGWSAPAEPWVRRRDGSLVDLHVSLAGVAVEPEAVWGLLSGSTEAMRLAGSEVQVLAPHARALHLALHVTQHEGGHGQALRDLQLAVELLDIEVWRGAVELADRLDAVPAFALGLHRLPDGADLADRLALSSSGHTRSALEMSRLRHSLRALKAAPSLRARAMMLTAKVVPSPRFMRNWSSLARRGTVGLAVAYVWRPLWLLGRTVSAVAGRLRRNHPQAREPSRDR